jgi:hypothetical protein
MIGNPPVPPSDETVKITDAGSEHDVPALIEKLIAAIAAQAESAVQKARAEAHAEFVKVQTVVADLERDVASERQETGALRVQLRDAEVARRASETARQETVRERDRAAAERDRVAAEYESRLKKAHAELDSARATIAKLEEDVESARGGAAAVAAAVESIQRALARNSTTGPEPGGSGRPTARGQSESAPKGKGESAREPKESVLQSVSAASPRLDRSEAAALAEAHPELVAYAGRLLDDIEAMYQADRESAPTSAQVIERLTANLRYGRELFLRHAGSAADREPIFKQQLMSVLDAKWETEFGRHLTFAAYEVYPRSERSFSAA